jgi:hypothetical protein
MTVFLCLEKILSANGQLVNPGFIASGCIFCKVMLYTNHPDKRNIRKLREGTLMTKNTTANECADPMQIFTVELPCRIVRRIERYATENGTSMPSVLIEALDSFLSKPK